MNTFYTHTHNVVSVCDKYEKMCVSGQNKTCDPGTEEVGCLVFGTTRTQPHK